MSWLLLLLLGRGDQGRWLPAHLVQAGCEAALWGRSPAGELATLLSSLLL